MTVLGIIALQVLAFFAFFGLFKWIRGNKNAGRNKTLSEIAPRLGLKKINKIASGVLHQLKPFELFSRERSYFFRKGNSTDVYSKVIGDTTVYLFEYIYTKKQGNRNKTIRHLVFFADDKKWYLPNFKLEPETWWHKVMSKLGKKDINFPKNEEFSDSYWLTAEFEEQTRTLFRPELKAFLNARPPIKMEGSNYYLLASVEDELSPQGIKAFYNDCADIVKLLKSDERQDILELSELIPSEKVLMEGIEKLRE